MFEKNKTFKLLLLVGICFFVLDLFVYSLSPLSVSKLDSIDTISAKLDEFVSAIYNTEEKDRIYDLFQEALNHLKDYKNSAFSEIKESIGKEGISESNSKILADTYKNILLYLAKLSEAKVIVENRSLYPYKKAGNNFVLCLAGSISRVAGVSFDGDIDAVMIPSDVDGTSDRAFTLSVKRDFLSALDFVGFNRDNYIDDTLVPNATINGLKSLFEPFLDYSFASQYGDFQFDAKDFFMSLTLLSDFDFIYGNESFYQSQIESVKNRLYKDEWLNISVVTNYDSGVSSDYYIPKLILDDIKDFSSIELNFKNNILNSFLQLIYAARFRFGINSSNPVNVLKEMRKRELIDSQQFKDLISMFWYFQQLKIDFQEAIPWDHSSKLSSSRRYDINDDVLVKLGVKKEVFIDKLKSFFSMSKMLKKKILLPVDSYSQRDLLPDSDSGSVAVSS